MHGAQPPDAGVAEPFEGPDPQFEVGAHGVFHQHREVAAAQCVGHLLHGERIGRGAGAEPQQVDARIERRRRMFGRGHLRGDVHARFALHAPQPRERFDAYALESAGFGAGLPYPRAEDADAVGGQGPRRGEHLLLGLGAARSGDDRRALRRDLRKYYG